MTSRFPAPADAPIADQRPTHRTVHGVELADDYDWLRAKNWQEAMREPAKLPADIAAYLTAENDYYDRAMADTQTLQEKLVSEMRGRIKEDDSSVPHKRGAFAYGYRFVDGGEYPLLVRSDRDGGAESIVMDVNKLAASEAYFQLGSLSLSPDDTRLAWTADTNGSEFRQLAIRDIASGEDAPYKIKDVGSVAWLDDQSLLYVRVDENHRPNKVYRHVLNTDPGDDTLVFEEADERYYVGVKRLLSGKYIAITTGMNDENEVHVIKTDDPAAVPHLVEPRQPQIEYHLDHQEDRFVIVTNADDATDYKIVTAPIDAPSRANWTDLVPHVSGRTIFECFAYRNWTVWIERSDALPHLCFKPRGDGPEVPPQRVSFDEAAYSLSGDEGLEYDADIFRFVYSSPSTPSQTFDYTLSTGARELRKSTVIPSGHDPSNYVVVRTTAQSHDGAEVPVTLLHHRSTPIDGTAPCLIYGYGSYGHNMPANFSANRLSLVDRGFVYAIAHVRGGEEKGRAWYEDAKFARKPNTFHDMIAVSETLIAKDYTYPGGLVAQGGSAGGLLVGAVVNIRPDLFAGVIADVPFVDVLNTILDDTLPLTPGEWSQWGNPIESKDAFDDIRGYSPYDNVSAQDYPPMLVTAGVSDPRVTYWEPAKWVAKLRKTKTDDNVLLLRTNMTSGHFGKSGRFAALEDAARSFAFALKATGLA